MTANGAKALLPRASAKVRLLNPQPTFGLGDGDYSLCLTADPRYLQRELRFIPPKLSQRAHMCATRNMPP